jgi:hypothetical protein
MTHENQRTEGQVENSEGKPGAGCTCSPPSEGSSIQTRHETATPAPPSVDITTATITALTLERVNLREALRELVAFWDRREDSGWTAADVQRLEEIRRLVHP